MVFVRTIVIGDGKQFPHAGDARQFLRLAGGETPPPEHPAPTDKRWNEHRDAREQHHMPIVGAQGNVRFAVWVAGLLHGNDVDHPKHNGPHRENAQCIPRPGRFPTALSAGNPPNRSGRRKWSDAAFNNCWAGVIPPKAILGRSLLYVQSQRLAASCTSAMLRVCAVPASRSGRSD